MRKYSVLLFVLRRIFLSICSFNYRTVLFHLSVSLMLKSTKHASFIITDYNYNKNN